MRGIQYSDFVEVFNCLTALESNNGTNDCTYYIKSALWKSCHPSPLPFRSSIPDIDIANWDFPWARSIIVFVREFWRTRFDLLNNLLTVELRKLKFELNLWINESVLCANFGDPRSRDRDIRHKKNMKKRRNFGMKSC